MQRHIRHPDVVAGVHGDHVGQEEEIPAPAVDGVAGGVDGEHGVKGDRLVAIHAVRIVPGRYKRCKYPK